MWGDGGVGPVGPCRRRTAGRGGMRRSGGREAADVEPGWRRLGGGGATVVLTARRQKRDRCLERGSRCRAEVFRTASPHVLYQSFCTGHGTVRQAFQKTLVFNVNWNCIGCSTLSVDTVIRDLRQLRRGYRMWVICGSPDRFFKEATSTPSELRHVFIKRGSAVLPHSLRTRLQCHRVETPFGAGDDAVTDVCQKGDRATVLRNP